MAPRSSTTSHSPSVFFGPHKGAFRFFYLQAPDYARALCKVAQLDPNLLLTGEQTVPRDWLIRFWKEFDQLPLHASTPNALAAGRLFLLQDLGDWGKVFQHAPQFRVALQHWEKWLEQNQAHLYGLPESMKLVPGRLEFQWPSHDLPPAVVLYWCSTLLTSLLGLGLTSSNITLIQLPSWALPKKETEKRKKLEELKREFGIPFQATPQRLTLHFQESVLKKASVHADPSLFRFFEARLQNRSEARAPRKLSWPEEVRYQISARLEDPHLSSEVVSQTLGLSQRTFERKLQALRLNFRTLKQEVQEQRACELLVSGSTSKEVAQSVGFEDFSSFSRAFKKWTGQTPVEFRKKQTKRKTPS
jgi:AraC-like DNA-binding protein